MVARRTVLGAEELELQIRSRRDRSRKVIKAAIERHANDHAVMMFTHGGILQYMLAALMGTERIWGVSIGNTAVFDFTLDLERWSVDGAGLQNNCFWHIVHFNDASHLA